MGENKTWQLSDVPEIDLSTFLIEDFVCLFAISVCFVKFHLASVSFVCFY